MTHAIGGTVTVSGSYRIHTFNASSSIFIDESGSIEYLVVGGGGSGGGDHGGGGGGGEVKTATLAVTAGTTYTIVIGAGGTASTGRGNAGTSGGSTAFGAVVATGGGRAGQYPDGAGGSGSSGGGGASFSGGGAAGTATSNGVTGYNGKVGNNNGAGGGGGMGSLGGVTYASQGGAGVSSSISGAAVGYGGGGGGADSLAPNNPSLGQDGGGNGNNRGTTIVGTAGTANRGGGGGGSTSSQVGTAGGSGVVIVRYLATTTTRRQIHTEDISFQSLPEFPYKGTKAGVEAIAAPVEGMRAFATDTKLSGFYNGTIWVWGSASSGHVIQDEGTPLTARANLNFKGAGVTATDNAGTGATDITIAGGGGGGLSLLPIDLTAQIIAGGETHFDLVDATTTIAVYIDGVLQHPSDVTLDIDGLGFTLGFGVLITDNLIVVVGSAGGSGDALKADPLSQFAATTSAQLAGVISDETGSGKLVFSTSPSLVTPDLGVATATSVMGLTTAQVTDLTDGGATTLHSHSGGGAGSPALNVYLNATFR